MTERLSHDSGQNQDRNTGPAGMRSNMPQECIILLKEFIRSNQALGSVNEKLRQQQEHSNKANREALQRIENCLVNGNSGDCGANVRRRQNRGERQRTVAVPPACRLSRKT